MAAKPRLTAEAKPTWRQTLERHAPVLLPAAHDGLTARLIEEAGFVAYQVGGFAYADPRLGFPDIDLIHFGEIGAGLRDIVVGSSLPVMVDADDGYGDSKNVTRTDASRRPIAHSVPSRGIHRIPRDHRRLDPRSRPSPPKVKVLRRPGGSPS